MASPATATGRVTIPDSSNADVRVDLAEDGSAWDAFVAAQSDATIDHAWGWRQIFTGVLGHETVYLTASRGQTIVGALPVVLFQSRLFGRSAISLPFVNDGGVIGTDAAAAAALLDRATGIARQFGASHLELRHRGRRFEQLPYRQHKLGLSRPLPASADDLWNQIDRKIRNQVRKARKEGLETATGGAELVPEFYAVFSQNMRDLGTPVVPRRLFEETCRVFGERARLTVVRLAGRPVAGAVTLQFRRTVVNPWASSLREFRHLSPNMLLYWTLMEQAIAAGAETFDFGRSSPGGGTHQFKVQWGGIETPLHWEYVLLTRAEPPNQGPTNPKFERAIRLWQRLPLSVANAIGPRIARHLP
jgi:serine/alanine adding enzyme